ncbi:hypothetical protein GCM10018980_17410 [Streptomyces capoamus]|uniref:Uncharacterized protein n=1 Tax=Streptomyces capoamus TaxID=68183 RepID=A0A919C292_9ACTN|nr:hypothetical protein [Streptomyces capoamus]GGW16116.1 hypothetical protein GCM10010501_31030 [Streptomyces libani subsp. rufus]GHG42076.1 hypothetical protein GCM10018980_17410 [Streptomyces capoamus]
MQMSRRIAIAGASTVLAAGATMIGGGPASAHTAPAPVHHPAAVVPAAAPHHTGRHHAARQPTDPWIEDQLATFYPSSEQRLAVFDPWVKDQLALFQKSAG